MPKHAERITLVRNEGEHTNLPPMIPRGEGGSLSSEECLAGRDADVSGFSFRLSDELLLLLSPLTESLRLSSFLAASAPFLSTVSCTFASFFLVPSLTANFLPSASFCVVDCSPESFSLKNRARIAFMSGAYEFYFLVEVPFFFCKTFQPNRRITHTRRRSE